MGLVTSLVQFDTINQMILLTVVPLRASTFCNIKLSLIGSSHSNGSKWTSTSPRQEQQRQQWQPQRPSTPPQPWIFLLFQLFIKWKLFKWKRWVDYYYYYYIDNDQWIRTRLKKYTAISDLQNYIFLICYFYSVLSLKFKQFML